MPLRSVPAGLDLPSDFNTVVEIPLRGDPVKYEIDKETGAMCVDRFLNTAMHYPCNYGYIPQTLSEDGDPLDVLVITGVRLIPSAVIRCRPVGMLTMSDESGPDAKILAVPVDKLSSMYSHVAEPQDFPAVLLDQIAHFFEHYKDLEPEKWVKIDGWQNTEAAQTEIMAAVTRFSETPDKPNY